MFEGVAVGETESAAVALTLGVTSPLILLPAQHRDWEPSRLRSVLMHELAHVRRKDCLIQWLPQIVCALHWFNPLAWLSRAQMLCESERACDDAVLRGGASGPDFARDLLDIAESSGLKGADPMLVTIATRLERRIARLLDASVDRQSLTPFRAAATSAIVVALLLPLAAVRGQNGTQTGNLSGVVSDPTGAVIAKAAVNLTGPAGNLGLATNPAGVWTANGLAPGVYQVEVSVPGFAAFREQNVTLAPGASVQLKEPLAIGQIAETVTVVGAGTSPSTATATAPPRRIRVGGNVQFAKLISKTPPVYPDAERTQGVEATVRVQAIIGKSGNVMDAHVIGGPKQDFADAALNAVRTWQYEPTRLNGEPVEVITTITVNFQLQ
jgi:TonB family protein